MRLNKYLAAQTGMSRRSADRAISEGRVEINQVLAKLGDIVVPGDKVSLDGDLLSTDRQMITLMLHKPIDYVVSREGQGSRTIYELLPKEYCHLKPIGRLDKDSSGLLLLTNDGQLAHQLTHPRYQKIKIYEVEIDKSLSESDKHRIEQGIELADGVSRLKLLGSSKQWQITMSEGRNRQIRRTFAALGYNILNLHRVGFGEYKLGSLQQGKYDIITPDE